MKKKLVIASTISIIILILLLVYFTNNTTEEKWSNSFSGWPGPLESGCSSCYNIPALHPRYNADKHYKYGLQKNSPYMSMGGYP